MVELTLREKLEEMLTNKIKTAELLARISLFAFIVFAAYGWLINEQRIIYTGIFFLVCFFGFLYAKRMLSSRDGGTTRTFMGTTVKKYEDEKRFD